MRAIAKPPPSYPVGKGIDEESHITQLPLNIQILLTSRPLPDIENALNSVEHVKQKSTDSIPSMEPELQFPLEEHEGCVVNSKCIVSGSDNNSTQLWDAQLVWQLH